MTLFLYSTNIDTYIYMSTHPYEYMYIHFTSMSTSKRCNRFDFEIHEVSHQERFAIDTDVAFH
jgi:hypothetical protein